MSGLLSKAKGLPGNVIGRATAAAAKVKGAVGKPGTNSPGNPAAAAPPNAATSSPDGPVAQAKVSLNAAQAERATVEQNNLEAAQRRKDAIVDQEFKNKGPIPERFKFFKDKLNFFSTPLKKVLGLMFDRKYPISHYIALILIIMLLLGMLSFFAFRGGKKSQKKSGKKSMFDRMFPNSYKASLLARRFAGGDIPTEPRDTIVGRCDNVQYKEVQGMCVNTKFPSPIIWDLQSLEELKSIPQALRDKITKDGVLLKVFIPWKSAGDSYIPDCSNAYYMNGEKSFLLRDDGFQCTKSTFTKISYNEAQRINKLFSTYKGLDTFE